jgi:hypothetical protein
MRGAVSTATALLCLAGCGSTERTGGETDRAATVVQVSLDPDGEGDAPSAATTLRCPSDTQRRACQALEDAPKDVWLPVPDDRACTARYGGPQIGRVSGIVGDRKVNVLLTRRNGCEIARFDQLAAVLQVAPAARP